MSKNLVQKLIDSGMEFTEVSRAQAEAVVKHLVRAGELRRSEAGRTAQLLVDKGRETSAAVAGAIQTEASKQVEWLAARVDDLERQLEALVSSGAAALPGAKKPAADVAAKPSKKAPAKKGTAKKTTAKKTTAKKTTAKKTNAKKQSATKKKKAGAKKAGSKRSGAKAAAKQAAATPSAGDES